jgi:hypothetical protein
MPDCLSGGSMAAMTTDAGGSEPAVDEWEFAEPVWYWRGPAPYHYVTVPERVCDGVREWAFISYGWGMIPVTVTIGETTWPTSLFPKDGGYVLPLRDNVRAAEDLEIDDAPSVILRIRRDSV